MSDAEAQVKPLYAMAFFDGQNLFRHAKEAFGYHHPNYDICKLHNAVCAQQGWTPNLVRFYTGVPSPAESPMWAGYWSSRIIAMKRAGVKVTTRAVRYHKQNVTQDDGSVKVVTTAHEKGIDVRLALDVVSTARTRQYDVAVIYSQDQDLAELSDEIKQIGKDQGRQIIVASAYPYSNTASTNRGIDRTDWIRMNKDFYDACIDPHDYRPKKDR